MKTQTAIKLIASLIVAGITASAQAQLITKSPDLGDFWQPLYPVTGTYVYADSFVAPGNVTVSSLGTWLNTLSYDPTTAVKFQVWGSVGNNAANGPDAGNVLSTTAGITGMNGALSFYSAPTTSSLTLAAGNTYWFAATVVGSAGAGRYQVGGHTQNSGGITDNGTFWYSNDPLGQAFDGSQLTPEMAFQVQLTTVPEPTTLALAGLGGLAALVVARRRK